MNLFLPSPLLKKILRPSQIIMIASAVVLSGCSSVDESGSLFGFLTPFRPDIQQGNWVTQSQVDALQKGMSKEQVRYALGTPLVRDVFHADRWDYVYRFRSRGGVDQNFYLSVFFKDNQLVTWKNSDLPNHQPFQQPEVIESISQAETQ